MEIKDFNIPAARARAAAENVNRSRATTIIRENIQEAFERGNFSTRIADYIFTQYPDMETQLIEIGYKIERVVGQQVKISW